jgi:uncharacterized membrane protein YgcG
MLNGVASLKFSCYDGTQWQDAWDTSNPTSLYTNLPAAVRVDIQMAGPAMKSIEFVVPIDSQPRQSTNATVVSSSASSSSSGGASAGGGASSAGAGGTGR